MLHKREQDLVLNCLPCGKNAYITNEEQNLHKTIGKSGAVVVNLLKDLFGTGRKLWIDNYYSSEALFRLLESNNIVTCGTLRKGCVKLPKSYTSSKLV